MAGARGVKLRLVSPFDEVLQGRYSIGIGASPRGAFNHAVICKSGRLVFDPHPSDDGVLSFDRHEILVELTEAEQALHARGLLFPSRKSLAA